MESQACVLDFVYDTDFTICKYYVDMFELNFGKPFF